MADTDGNILPYDFFQAERFIGRGILNEREFSRFVCRGRLIVR